MSEPRELTLDATVENVAAVTNFVDAQLKDFGCPPKVQTALDVAIDEIFSNISHYAYAPHTGTATVRVAYDADPPSVALTFLDSGIPYDPLKKPDPDITLSADERDIGGLGIYIVKKSMDDVRYTRRGGQNILTLRKNL